MIVAGSASPLLLASAGGGYNLTRSLRIRQSASANLSRTPSTASNRKTWTWSSWVKRGVLNTARQGLFGCNPSTGGIGFGFSDGGGAGDKFTYTAFGVGYGNTTAVFRDPSAWYHIVVTFDSTQATAANRFILNINNVRYTFDANIIDLNADYLVNSTNEHLIGSLQGFNNFDGYLAETNFIAGQALTPSSFGEYNSRTGAWQPIKYAGTYGTNGFYLPFTNITSTSTLGNDFSGNGNNWTSNNISLTAGVTYDSMTDVPTLTSATAANYPTLNPLDTQTTSELPSSGNLNANGGNNIRATMSCPSTGKYYFEYTRTNTTDSAHVGVMSSTSAISSLVSGCILYRNDGNVYVNNSVVTTYASFTTNDVIGVGMDMDTGNIYFSKNNTYQGAVGLASAGITVGNVVPMIRNNTGATASVNFGQRPFVYSPSSGFVALNTFNLPTPTIGATASTQANKYMDVNTYTGNNTTNVITNSGGMQPDFVWMKRRDNVNSHALVDVVRGTNKQICTDRTGAEETNSAGAGLQSFNSNGFTLGTESTASGGTNINGATYVAWQWDAGTSTVTNTSGSISSQVRANPSSGFSIVTYTGTGSPATVGHGLGVAPRMIIVKRLNGNVNWAVYNSIIGNTNFLQINTTVNSTAQGANNFWNSTNPTSSVFSVGTVTDTNASGGTYVAYCFSEIAGYSRFGSYVGNGNSDGPFAFTGFRPEFVLVKNITSSQSWQVMDAARSPFNVATENLIPNLWNAESTGTDYVDFLSNGFKIRQSSAGNWNNNGDTYIFMTFAQNPFKYSLAR